jgi:glycosyltransferase involved in cell wall biosynthesis
MTIDLTIGIPTLNCLSTLRLTLESIRPLFEAGAKVVLADSYSTDGTPEYARHYGAHVVNVPKGSLAAALNAALGAAETKWLAYVNADDLLYSDTIIRALSTMNPMADIVYGSIDFIDYQGCFIHGLQSVPENYLLALSCSGHLAANLLGMLFRQDVFRKLNGFDTTFQYAFDFDFSFRAIVAGFKFWHMARPPIGAYRLHANQYSNRSAKVGVPENRVAIRRSGVKISPLERIRAVAYYRMINLSSYVLRSLRGRQLSGSYRLRRSVEWPQIS